MAILSSDVLKQIRKIEIRTNKIVNELFAGRYHSVFKGRGMEFSEVREYSPGDDVRLIDWKVSARFGDLYVRKYIEERELTIMLLVDMSASQWFSSCNRTKSAIVAEMAAMLSFSALRNNDKVGLLMFTSEIEKYIPCKKTRTHVLYLIREILYFQPKYKQTDIAKALTYLNRIQKRRGIVFLISDFFDTGYEDVLKVTAKHHDLIIIIIRDPLERTLPYVPLLELEDKETGAIITIDARDEGLRRLITAEFDNFANRQYEFFKKIGVDYISITTAMSYVKPLIEFFKLRARRFR
jgi:uncharacterized protein (DUF58 family)